MPAACARVLEAEQLLAGKTVVANTAHSAFGPRLPGSVSVDDIAARFPARRDRSIACVSVGDRLVATRATSRAPRRCAALDSEPRRTEVPHSSRAYGNAASGRRTMTSERAAVVDDSLGQLVRETVREVLREELAAATPRNTGTSIGADDGFLSVAKAARVADVAPGTIRAWIRAGRLTAQHAGRVLRISRRELAQFMMGALTGPNGAETERRAAHLFGHRGPLRPRIRNTYNRNTCVPSGCHHPWN